MEKLPKNQLLEYHSETLHNVRKLYNLEDPKRLNEAIDILQEWARQQNHFVVTEFDRDYLEKIIITNKGLLERSKVKFDKICTLRTFIPEFFAPINVKTDLSNLDCLPDGLLPKLTCDDHRVYILQNNGNQFTSKVFLDYYIRTLSMWQYLQRHDYNAGYIIVLDLTNANLTEMLKSLNLGDLRKFMTIITEGYGSRIQHVYAISNSKLIHTLFDLIKPAVSKKITERLEFLNDRQSLKTKISEDVLPSDYGGKEKSMAEINQDWVNVLSLEDHIEHAKKMIEVKTDESKRQVAIFNEEYLGMPGTFRTLSVD